MTLTEQVIKIVSVKTTDLQTIDESLLTMTVEEIEQAILSYCNLEIMPEQLKYTWANMVEDQLRYYVALTTQSTGDTSINAGDISQLKIGDTTINLDGSKNTSQTNKALKSHNANLDNIIRNYKQYLNKYRRMVW